MQEDIDQAVESKVQVKESVDSQRLGAGADVNIEGGQPGVVDVDSSVLYVDGVVEKQLPLESENGENLDVVDERSECGEQIVDEGLCLDSAFLKVEHTVEALQPIVEAILFAASKPMSVRSIQKVVGGVFEPASELVEETLQAIQVSFKGRGVHLVEVASGYRFQVPEPLVAWVHQLQPEKPQRYSRALLETLALIAYRQPITRGEIEDIRGVAVSSHIIKTLQERHWVRVVGHKEVPGRPALLATTAEFLDYFNLKSLQQLPALSEVRNIEDQETTLLVDESAEEGAGEPSVETRVLLASQISNEQSSQELSFEALTAKFSEDSLS